MRILSLIRYTTAKKVLDIGCGEGYLLRFLSDNIRNCRFEGSDLNAESVKLAKERNPLISLDVRNIYSSGYPESSFDLVLCVEVLEHLSQPEMALSEIRRIARRWVILSVPNEPFFTVANLLCGKDISRCGNNKDHHNHWSTRAFLRLAKNYFKVSKIMRPFPWTVLLCEKI